MWFAEATGKREVSAWLRACQTCHATVGKEKGRDMRSTEIRVSYKLFISCLFVLGVNISSFFLIKPLLFADCKTVPVLTIVVKRQKFCHCHTKVMEILFRLHFVGRHSMPLFRRVTIHRMFAK